MFLLPALAWTCLKFTARFGFVTGRLFLWIMRKLQLKDAETLLVRILLHVLTCPSKYIHHCHSCGLMRFEKQAGTDTQNISIFLLFLPNQVFISCSLLFMVDKEMQLINNDLTDWTSYCFFLKHLSINKIISNQWDCWFYFYLLYLLENDMLCRNFYQNSNKADHLIYIS